MVWFLISCLKIVAAGYGKRKWRDLNNMSKPLKIWNGRGFESLGDHLYICAKNRRQAARLMLEAWLKIKSLDTTRDWSLELGRNYRKITNYFCEGAWGNSMDGITPEIGVWYAPAIGGGHAGKPERII